MTGPVDTFGEPVTIVRLAHEGGKHVDFGSLGLRHLLGILAGLGLATASAQTFERAPSAVLGTQNLNGISISLGDYDADGDLDVLVQGSHDARRLLRNDSTSTQTLAFTNVTPQLGPVASDTTGWSAAWGDYNGDGRVDVFLGQANPRSARGDLFRNDHPLGFVDVSASTINEPGFHQNVAWNYIDNDGDLDLIIGMEGPERHEIYIQNSDGSFTPVGAAAGLQVDFGTKAYGMAVGDYDGDGDLDIYISTCIQGGNIRNNFFDNRLVPDGTLTFVDIADSNGTQYLANSYGTEFVDLDNDGDLDLYVTGADGNPTRIFRNDGGGAWSDIATVLGSQPFANNGADLNGSKAVDYDNDGDLDFFFHDHLARTLNQAMALYRNDGNWAFVDVTEAEGLLWENEGGYDSAWGDIDGDGDMDLITATNSSFPERLYVSNAAANGNHWLQVRLRGRKENTTAIGATLYATIHKGTPQERTLRREANTNAGTFNQSDLPVHFGLGAAAVIETLRVVWPDKKEQILTNVEIDRYLTIQYPEGDVWSLQ